MGFVNLRIENHGKIAARRRSYIHNQQCKSSSGAKSRVRRPDKYKQSKTIFFWLITLSPSGRLITDKVMMRLNIKSKVDDIAILYDVVLAFQAHFPGLFSTLLTPQPDIVLI